MDKRKEVPTGNFAFTYISMERLRAIECMIFVDWLVVTIGDSPRRRKATYSSTEESQY